MNEKIPNQLLFGGESDGYDDYKTLTMAAGKKSIPGWSCLKNAKKGDLVLIYCVAPHQAVVASAEVMRDAERGENWPYVTTLGNVQLLKSPIHRTELQGMFPEWSWAKFTRGRTNLEPQIAKRLWERVIADASKYTESVIAANGAGFGDAKENELVEKAAVKKVTNLLKKRGFSVKSREKEKIGYDLDATKGRQVLHVEVKGISGAALQFPITAAEVRRAETDPAFRLYAVTGAQLASFKVHEYTGVEFNKVFVLTPLNFMASNKPTGPQ